MFGELKFPWTLCSSTRAIDQFYVFYFPFGHCYTCTRKCPWKFEIIIQSEKPWAMMYSIRFKPASYFIEHRTANFVIIGCVSMGATWNRGRRNGDGIKLLCEKKTALMIANFLLLLKFNGQPIHVKQQFWVSTLLQLATFNTPYVIVESTQF